MLRQQKVEIHFVSILMLNLTNLPCIFRWTFITDFHTCPFVIMTIVKVCYTANVFSSLKIVMVTTIQ